MKRLSQFLTLFFLFIYLNSTAQSDFRLDRRVDALLKQVDAKRPGLMMFSRKNDGDKYVNMAVLSDSTRSLTWFTCYGQAFDVVKPADDVYNKIKSGTLDPFSYYKDYFSNLLSHITTAAAQFRQKGKTVLNDTNNIYHQVYTYPSVQQAGSTLQKEVAMERLMSDLYLQRSLFDSRTPQHLYSNDSFQLRLQLAGKMVRKGDTTTYYNANPLSSAARIVLYKRNPGKMLVYDRLGQLTDSVPLKQGKYASLLNDKEDVFLLYRGWLELQSQQAIAGKEEVDRLLNREYTMLYKPASWEEHKQQLQQTLEEVQEKIDAVGNKVQGLILPSPEQATQLLAAVYRDKPAEISYISGSLGFGYSVVYIRGNKHYELTNHLGNVLAVVSDRKKAVDENGDGSVEYYNADVASAVDYLPFGAQMPGRTYNSNDKYRYGFNGKENDNEIKGEGNQQDYGMRIYDPRIGRFLSVDPLSPQYPWYTPYQFAGDKPIWAIDIDGLEELIAQYRFEDGKATLLRVINNTDVRIRYTSNSERNGQQPFVRDIYDKRTGKLMNPAELGQIQYQYFSSDGKRLNIRRNYDGDYVKGDNEMMPIKERNLFSTIYVGPSNPTITDANGEDRPDYRREPSNELDAAALQHDQGYDKQQAAGATDAFFNRKVTGADKKLIQSAQKIIAKAKTGEKDDVTGKPVTPKTASDAKKVARFFNFIVNVFKDNEKLGKEVEDKFLKYEKNGPKY